MPPGSLLDRNSVCKLDWIINLGLGWPYCQYWSQKSHWRLNKRPDTDLDGSHVVELLPHAESGAVEFENCREHWNIGARGNVRPIALRCDSTLHGAWGRRWWPTVWGSLIRLHRVARGRGGGRERLWERIGGRKRVIDGCLNHKLGYFYVRQEQRWTFTTDHELDINWW